MSDTKLKWEDVYVLPLRPLFNSYSKIVTSQTRMAFDFIGDYFVISDVDCKTLSTHDKEKIVKVLNDELNEKGEKILIKSNLTLTHERNLLKVNGLVFAVIRGWGYLTGVGGFNVSSEEAQRIQNDFAEFIVKKLQQSCVAQYVKK